jgi:exodeoxyribonuclease V alpha subunit
MLEAVTVRHYTSRAGDPHRHLHLQIGARVFATEQWRGLHTVGMRDFFAAINGIGRSLDRYERDWMAAHPDEQPGPALRRAWDGRAWAEGRPDKVIPRSGADLVARWRAELGSLGYRDPAHPVSLAPTPIGALDREAAVDTVLTRLAAGRSAWNAADVRGEAERVIAAKGIVADPAVRL